MSLWGTLLMVEPSRRSYQAFGLIYQDWQKEPSQISGCRRDSSWRAARLGGRQNEPEQTCQPHPVLRFRIGFRGSHSAQPRTCVPGGNRGRDADRLTDGGGNERGLRHRRGWYRIGSVPQVLATS